MQIVSGARDRTIKLWNTIGECKYTIGEPDGHTEWVSCVRFSPVTQNPIIVSAGWDRLVKVSPLAPQMLASKTGSALAFQRHVALSRLHAGHKVKCSSCICAFARHKCAYPPALLAHSLSTGLYWDVLHQPKLICRAKNDMWPAGMEPDKLQAEGQLAGTPGLYQHSHCVP